MVVDHSDVGMSFLNYPSLEHVGLFPALGAGFGATLM